MKQIIISKKTKAIIYAIAFFLVFCFGVYVRPGVDIAVTLASSLFVSKQQVYVAPPSEYETKVNELWKSDKHQQVCKAVAASIVSVDLARHYLDEYEKQNVLAQWDTPLSEAVGNVSKKK